MIYLIDYENVGDSIFSNMSILKEKDELIIFYNQNSSKLSFTSHLILTEIPNKKEYINVKVGTKNALDFQLSTYLGYLAANAENCEYSIVSKDTGFDAIRDFWKARNIKIKRIQSLEGTATKKNNSIENAIASFGDDAKIICDIIANHKTKQAVNNALVKEFGSERAGEMYKAVKSHISKKNK